MVGYLRPPKKAKKGYRGGKPKTVYVDMGLWFDSDTGHIHMTLPTEQNFHTTVSNKKGLRCHKNLYKKLMKVLRKEKVI